MALFVFTGQPLSTQSCSFHLSFSAPKWWRVCAGATTGLPGVSSEKLSRASCVCASCGQVNISEKQYELNHFSNKTRPHAPS